MARRTAESKVSVPPDDTAIASQANETAAISVALNVVNSATCL
jgi:hypothetical protein